MPFSGMCPTTSTGQRVGVTNGMLSLRSEKESNCNGRGACSVAGLGDPGPLTLARPRRRRHSSLKAYSRSTLPARLPMAPNCFQEELGGLDLGDMASTWQ
jgi:hypothetical protein